MQNNGRPDCSAAKQTVIVSHLNHFSDNSSIFPCSESFLSSHLFTRSTTVFLLLFASDWCSSNLKLKSFQRGWIEQPATPEDRGKHGQTRRLPNTKWANWGFMSHSYLECFQIIDFTHLYCCPIGRVGLAGCLVRHGERNNHSQTMGTIQRIVKLKFWEIITPPPEGLNISIKPREEVWL